MNVIPFSIPKCVYEKFKVKLDDIRSAVDLYNGDCAGGPFFYAIKPVRITFGLDEKSKTGGGYPSQQIHQQFGFLFSQGSRQVD
jgi:hypothetical protein